LVFATRSATIASARLTLQFTANTSDAPAGGHFSRWRAAQEILAAGIPEPGRESASISKQFTHDIAVETDPDRAEVTRLLLAWSEGDQEALNRLTPIVYQELHRLATIYMSRERNDHTLQPTALVNEAFLRLVDLHGVG
jgi:ECF sigma factor